MMLNIVSLAILIFLPVLSIANSNSHLPRFVSTKSDHVNARKGPGVSYPIDWVYVKIHEPLKVVQEFEEWRRIEDMKGLSGWVHSSIISKQRYVIVTCDKICNMYKSKKDTSSVAAKLEQGLRCSLEKSYGAWTKIKCLNHKGYIRSSNLWGLLSDESKDK